MREEKLLARILRDLASLVAEEAARNPQFAERLEALLEAVPQRKKALTVPAIPDDQLPDLFAEARTRSVENYEEWLAGLSIPVLKKLLRKHDIDSSRRTQKWTDPEKFAKLISEQIRARMRRGAVFLSDEHLPTVSPLPQRSGEDVA